MLGCGGTAGTVPNAPVPNAPAPVFISGGSGGNDPAGGTAGGPGGGTESGPVGPAGGTANDGPENDGPPPPPLPTAGEAGAQRP